jgi:hypothetical protein
MRCIVFLGALLVSAELLGASIAAAAMPANGTLFTKTNSSGNVTDLRGCGQWMKYNPRTEKCESF